MLYQIASGSIQSKSHQLDSTQVQGKGNPSAVLHQGKNEKYVPNKNWISIGLVTRVPREFYSKKETRFCKECKPLLPTAL